MADIPTLDIAGTLAEIVRFRTAIEALVEQSKAWQARLDGGVQINTPFGPVSVTFGKKA